MDKLHYECQNHAMGAMPACHGCLKEAQDECNDLRQRLAAIAAAVEYAVYSMDNQSSASRVLREAWDAVKES